MVVVLRFFAVWCIACATQAQVGGRGGDGVLADSRDATSIIHGYLRPPLTLTGADSDCTRAKPFQMYVCSRSYVVYRINERNQGNDDEDYDIPTGYFAIFIVPAVLSTVGFLAASMFAFKAVCSWPEDGALRENQDQNTPPV